MSNLERKLSGGEFVVTAELPVIDGGGHAELQRQLEPMRPFVDAFNATDNPAAHAHVSPLAVAIGLAEVGAEPIMQLVCRDRNFVRTAHDIGLTQRIALIPSICILRSVGGIRFVANHVPGIDVPPETVRRVEQSADPEHECFDVAYELASHALAQPGVAGLHFISFRKDAGIAKLCGRLGIPPRIERESNGYSASVALG
jgi:methylenetetrahydrofolate reductase (NADPH)